MFTNLEQIFHRPEPFSVYTARELWADEHTSRKMLDLHLDETLDVSSRNAAFIDRSTQWLADHFQVGEKTRVIDFGCGPGHYASRLARRGADVTGLDFSERSISYARKTADDQNLPVRYLLQDYLEFEPDESYDIALMVMCDYCALSPEQRKKLLGVFRSCLKDGGRLLFDVYSLNAYNDRKETSACEMNLLDGFWSGNPYYGFLNTFKYDLDFVVLDKYTIIEDGRSRTISTGCSTSPQTPWPVSWRRAA